MYRIIDKRGSGKTSRLMLLVKENDGILVCSNPQAMRVKAHNYGFNDLQIISYRDYYNHNYEYGKMIFIDELDLYIRSLGNNISGYSLTLED